MLVDLDNMLDAMVKQQLNVSHLEKKITSKVIPVKKLNSTFKKVINDEYDSKLLKDADYVIAFYENQVEEKPAVAGVDDGGEDKEKEEEVETTDTEKEETSTEEGGEETEEETTEEDPEFGVEDDTEEETEEVSDEETTEEEPVEDEEDEEDENKKEQVNENIKIQDLTKSMLSPIKPKTPKSSTPKKDNNKKTTPKKDNKKKCGCECENLEEAETEATGEELRSKVSKALENTFKSQLNDTNKIELYDIKSTKENCYFAKITLKKRDSQTNDKN